VPAALTTELTELPDSRVRLQVQVPPAEVERSMQRKARELGARLRVPGFRRGKVPTPIVIRRVGREAVLEEAVRDTLASWYADAVGSSGIVPVGDPQLEVGELPDAGQALQFSIEIGVLPKATLGDYKGLQVPRAEPNVPEQRIEQEIEAMRERLARLETAERPAATGDFVVIDYEGQLAEKTGGAGDAADVEDGPGGAQAPKPEADAGALEAIDQALSGRDELVELGASRLPEELERALIGASAGEHRTVPVSFPADQSGSPLAGRDVTLEVSVKEVKAKELPPLDDDFAIDAGYEDLQELRDEVRGRLEEVERNRVEAEFRETALDAAVDAASVSAPSALVAARAKEMWERMLHSLSHRGLSREAYLKIDGRSEEEILTELAPDAERALKREAVITAVVEAEGIEPTEEQLEQALAGAAGERGMEPAALLADLRRSGRLEELREDLAARTAIDLIAEHAEPIAPELAQAREKLWTPDR
jgi:trigger factor